jgi:hypothetical protein
VRGGERLRRAGKCGNAKHKRSNEDADFHG